MKIFQVEIFGGEYDSEYQNTVYVGTDFEKVCEIIRTGFVDGREMSSIDIRIWEKGKEIFSVYYDYWTKVDAIMAESKFREGKLYND